MLAVDYFVFGTTLFLCCGKEAMSLVFAANSLANFGCFANMYLACAFDVNGMMFNLFHPHHLLRLDPLFLLHESQTLHYCRIYSEINL